jgi:hypothetical protein
LAKKAKKVTKAAKKRVWRSYTKADEKELRAHSKAGTPVVKIAKLTKRTVGALRAKAHTLGIPLGHQLRSKKSSAKKATKRATSKKAGSSQVRSKHAAGKAAVRSRAGSGTTGRTSAAKRRKRA